MAVKMIVCTFFFAILNLKMNTVHGNDTQNKKPNKNRLHGKHIQLSPTAIWAKYISVSATIAEKRLLFVAAVIPIWKQGSVQGPPCFIMCKAGSEQSCGKTPRHNTGGVSETD